LESNLNKKRFVLATEPCENLTFNTSQIKDLTGGSETNARLLYSNNCKVYLTLSLFIECNVKPGFSGDINDALIRRVIDIPFESKFVRDEKQIDNIRVFKANEYYKTKNFREEYKLAMMHILLQNYKTYEIPKCIKERSLLYLVETHYVFKWFLENYERCPETQESETPRESGVRFIQYSIDHGYVSIPQEVLPELKNSTYYKALTKPQQKEITTPYLVKLFSENEIFRDSYTPRINTYYKGEQIKAKHLLKGWRKIRDEEKN